MRSRRFLCWFLILCLLAAPLSSLAEPVDSPQSAPENALQISVEYDEENAEWDGTLQARIRVSWDASDGSAAKDVSLCLETSDALILSQGNDVLELGDIEAGSSVTFGIGLTYDPSYEAPGHAPELTLKITAVGSGTGYAVYTGRLDGTTEPRVLVLGWEESDVGPRAVQTDLRMMKDILSESYYNGQPFDVEAYFNGRPLDADPALFSAETIESLLDQTEQWQEDANDITYIYLNAHGALLDNNIIVPAFLARSEKDSVWIGDREVTGGRLMTYPDMLQLLDERYKGRVVLITDVCYSGQLVLAAAELDLDVEKYALLTSSNWELPSKLWPDYADLNGENEDPLIDLPGIKLLFSYGWYTNDLCDLLDTGFAENENGVVTAYNAQKYLYDVSTKLQAHFQAALTHADKETFSLDSFSGLDDFIDSADVWSERMGTFLAAYGGDPLLFVNELDPLDALQQLLVLMLDMISPVFAGNHDALLYCDNPEYDDGKRLLTVVDESFEYMSALEMYYAYLREQVMPEIGLARREDLITDERGIYAAFWTDHWADLAYDQAVSGLLSAVVCDLDKNGSLDMITLTIPPCSAAQIALTGLYHAVNLDMYQIENGRVVRSDSRENILFVNRENVGIWSHMRCWMLDFSDQISFRANCFSSAGNSDEWVHSFSCTFRDGRIVDGAEFPYRENHVIQTEEGLPYAYSNWGCGYYDHMGDGVAFIEFFGEHRGDLYNAFDYTNLYEYIYGYAQPEVFVPLRLVAVPIGALPDEEKTPLNRRDEVTSGIDSAIEAAMNAAGKTAYLYSVSCDTETGEATQLILYSNLADYGAIDTEALRSMALAALEAPEVAAPEEAVSAMRSFEFSKKSPVEARAGNCQIQFMTIPDGSYVLVLDLNQ